MKKVNAAAGPVGNGFFARKDVAAARARVILAAIVCLSSWFAGIAHAGGAPRAGSEFYGRIFDYKDGDSFVMETDGGAIVEIRLHAVDAPEHDTVCRLADGTRWDCHASALAALYSATGFKRIRCRGIEYVNRRLIAICDLDGKDIAAETVAGGHAQACERFGDLYQPLEREAKRRRVGLWRGKIEKLRDCSPR